MGSDGNDKLTGGAGADDLDGGGGADTANYALSPAGVTVDLIDGIGFFGDAEGDKLARIERVIGSRFDDTLFGDDGANQLNGRHGDDNLYGRRGADILVGGRGLDYLYGERGSDTLMGGAGNDALFGGPGADILDGGSGDFDFAGYWGAASGVTVDLEFGVGLAGEADGDTLSGIEGLVGSMFADVLFGGLGNDVIGGLDGADTLAGDVGNDVVNGGGGVDAMYGGVGEDTFQYSAASDTGVGAGNRDVIHDWDDGGDADLIDVSAIDATDAPGDQAFTFIGFLPFDGTPGKLRWQQSGSDSIVQGDIDGDSVADFEIEIRGVIGIFGEDFIL